MTDQNAHEREIESLRNHNAELLTELKAAKASAKSLAEQVEALTAERDAARTEVRNLSVEQPVSAMLERIGAAPDILRLALDKHGLRFDLVDGKVTLLDADGERPTVADAKGVQRPVEFTADDLADYLAPKNAVQWDARQREFACLLKGTGVSGSGAASSQPIRHATGDDNGKRNDPPPTHTFGIK